MRSHTHQRAQIKSLSLSCCSLGSEPPLTDEAGEEKAEERVEEENDGNMVATALCALADTAAAIPRHRDLMLSTPTLLLLAVVVCVPGSVRASEPRSRGPITLRVCVTSGEVGE